MPGQLAKVEANNVEMRQELTELRSIVKQLSNSFTDDPSLSAVWQADNRPVDNTIININSAVEVERSELRPVLDWIEQFVKPVEYRFLGRDEASRTHTIQFAGDKKIAGKRAGTVLAHQR